MDKILIKNYKIFAYHGVHEYEKLNGQNFIIDMKLHLDLKKPCESDDVNDTVSYSDVMRKVSAVFTAEKYDLVEKAAQVVCDAVLESFPEIRECEITLKKPDAPINADFDYVAVEIRRCRNG